MTIGLIAGVLSFIAYCIYIATSIWGKTRPNRVTWWTLTILGVIVLFSSYAEGARDTLWIAGSYILGPLIVAIVSIWKGEGGWSNFDRVCAVFILISLVLWYFFNTPLIALVMSLVLDLVGLLPTIKKSYLRPEGEDGVAWSLEFVASVLSIFAITSWTVGIAIFPIYLSILNGLITILILRKHVIKLLYKHG